MMSLIVLSFSTTDLMIIIGSTRYTWVTMKNIGYHRVGWFSQVSQTIPCNPGLTPTSNTGAAGGSVKRPTNQSERIERGRMHRMPRYYVRRAQSKPKLKADEPHAEGDRPPFDEWTTLAVRPARQEVVVTKLQNEAPSDASV